MASSWRNIQDDDDDDEEEFRPEVRPRDVAGVTQPRQTRNPPPEKPGRGKNWVFQLTEKGEAHIGKIDAAMGR